MMSRTMSSALAIGALLLASGGAQPAADHDHGPPSLAKLGRVSFPVSCAEKAAKEFETAMAYYHSFAWPELKTTLDAVLASDPGCAMAHWARALGSLDNPFQWPGSLSPAVLAEGQAAIDAARAAGPRTPRERDYVEALALFYKDRATLDHATRARAVETAMKELAARHPEDKEATILYALVLSANFDPADKKYTNQLAAAALLEPIFKQQPDHPGAAHYLIHSYDYPPIAHLGLEAANRYASIAPDAPHALHMPSHIFTRVGRWSDSVEANRQSARIDGDQRPNSPHAYDYMVYAHLQLAQDEAARRVIAHARAVPNRPDHVTAAYAYAAMPARLVLEREAWAEAARLPLEPSAVAFSWRKYPQAEAINAFARGVGAAIGGDIVAAKTETARLRALKESAQGMRLGYWVEQIDIQAAIVRGLTDCAAGERDACLATLRTAAEREDATEKHVVSPGPILPAREVFAATLLRLDRPAEALREFEAVLAKEPNRYRAYAGALDAASRAGEGDKAKGFASRILEQTAAADSERSEFALARRLAGR